MIDDTENIYKARQFEPNINLAVTAKLLFNYYIIKILINLDKLTAFKYNIIKRELEQLNKPADVT